MKKAKWLCILITMTLYSCGNDQKTGAGGYHSKTNVTYSYPDVLSLDSANKMLSSYLNSINYQQTDTNVESFTFSAALLRKYLDSITGSSDIAYVKIMLGHKLSFINSGNINVNAGYSINAMTLLIAGYTDSGNYVFYPTSMVIDNSVLCPNNCPIGAAGEPLFQIPNLDR